MTPSLDKTIRVLDFHKTMSTINYNTRKYTMHPDLSTWSHIVNSELNGGEWYYVREYIRYTVPTSPETKDTCFYEQNLDDINEFIDGLVKYIGLKPGETVLFEF